MFDGTVRQLALLLFRLEADLQLLHLSKPAAFFLDADRACCILRRHQRDRKFTTRGRWLARYGSH